MPFTKFRTFSSIVFSNIIFCLNIFLLRIPYETPQIYLLDILILYHRSLRLCSVNFFLCFSETFILTKLSCLLISLPYLFCIEHIHYCFLFPLFQSSIQSEIHLIYFYTFHFCAKYACLFICFKVFFFYLLKYTQKSCCKNSLITLAFESSLSTFPLGILTFLWTLHMLCSADFESCYNPIESRSFCFLILATTQSGYVQNVNSVLSLLNYFNSNINSIL